MKNGWLVSGLLTALALAACSSNGSDDGIPTWSEFRAGAIVDPNGGFVVEGDQPARDEVELRAYYDQLVETLRRQQAGLASTQQALAINLVNGVDDKWSIAAATNITYCIDPTSLGTNFNAAVTALSSAAASWEAVARVNFIYLSAQNPTCNAANNNVVFNVRQVTTHLYYAKAFFPSAARGTRELLIDSMTFTSPPAPGGVAATLRHELGHILGFRHESTRPEGYALCQEDTNWRGVTAFDAASIMVPTGCFGTGSGELSALDRQGVAIIYPPICGDGLCNGNDNGVSCAADCPGDTCKSLPACSGSTRSFARYTQDVQKICGTHQACVGPSAGCQTSGPGALTPVIGICTTSSPGNWCSTMSINGYSVSTSCF